MSHVDAKQVCEHRWIHVGTLTERNRWICAACRARTDVDPETVAPPPPPPDVEPEYWFPPPRDRPLLDAGLIALMIIASGLCGAAVAWITAIMVGY